MPEFEVKFHFGAKKIKQRDVYVAALLINLAVNLLVRVLKVKPIQLWALIDEIGKRFKVRLINEIILQSPELLENRIEREVDKAIKEFEKAEPPEVLSIFTEIEKGDNPLGGEMRRRGTWVDE